MKKKNKKMMMKKKKKKKKYKEMILVTKVTFGKIKFSKAPNDKDGFGRIFN